MSNRNCVCHPRVLSSSIPLYACVTATPPQEKKPARVSNSILITNDTKLIKTHNSWVRRAITEILFKPAEEQQALRGGDESMEGVLSGALAIHKFGSDTQESKASSCMLWCTIALGAMTSNLSLPTVSPWTHAVFCLGCACPAAASCFVCVRGETAEGNLVTRTACVCIRW